MTKAVQDYYDDSVSHCYGCGRLNELGLQIKSYWDGDEVVCNFQPKPYHMAIPGYVYGGLIASLIDCHCIGTAAAAVYRSEGREMGSEPTLRYVTASLHVRYLRPTPMGPLLTIRAQAHKIEDRRVTISCSLYANGQECVRGEVIAVLMPDEWVQ